MWNCNHERSRAAINSEAARKVSSCDSVASASKAAIALTRGLHIVDLRRDAVAAKIKAAANSRSARTRLGTKPRVCGG